MNIGIDVDGVLTDLEQYQLTKGEQYFGIESVKNDHAYDIKDIFGCTSQEREKFWIKYIWEYSLKTPIRKNASSVIKKLKEEGNNIYIITGRVHTTKDNVMGLLFRKMLEKWLEDNEIVYNQIVYCDEKVSAEDKYDVCKQLGIDVMLEDKVDNIDKLKDICRVICFNAKYNIDYDNKEIPRVTNFDDAYIQIKQMEPNIITKKFNVLSGIEREKLSLEEKKEYYTELKKYYMNLPYDYSEMERLERNYKICFNVGMPIFNMMYKPIVINKDLIPEGNGYIFVSNHLGSLDQFPIMSAIGNRPIHFMAASTLYNLKRGFIYRNTGSIFVDRENSESKMAATQFMNQILVNDGNIFIFPEGTRNRTEKYMLDFKKGAVSIAQTTGAKIVPFAVNNNYDITKKLPLIVRVGETISVGPEDSIEEKTELLKEVIGTMIWENIELEKQMEDNKILSKKR